jgi:hypothetical protein
MPRFNGYIAFPFEVLAHLLSCYLLTGFLFLVIAVVVVALFGHGVDGAVLIAVLAARYPSGSVAVLQFVVMGQYWLNFMPRFPYAPPAMTFALATLFGALIVVATWVVENYSADASSQAIAVWIASHQSGLEQWFFGSVLASLLAALVGQINYELHWWFFGPPWAPTRWLGWLMVGREAYEDFIERERTRHGYAGFGS